MSLNETLRVTLELAGILEDLGIDYLVGGSVASSLHGIPRATQDVDMLARMEQSHVGPLVDKLGEQYYWDEKAIRHAVRQKGTFNLIHLNSMFKIDVFVCSDDKLLLEEMSRAKKVTVSEDPIRTLRVSDAADIVVQKLLWYEQGGRVSERQWNDVMGVLKVSGRELDLEYARKWAKEKGLEELLDEALAGCGVE